MPRKQHIVRLSAQDRSHLRHLVRTGTHPAWSLQRARIVLATDAGQNGPALTDEAVAAQLGVSARTVARTRAAWVTAGRGCLTRTVRATPAVPPLLSDAQALQIAAIACTTPPEGYARWSLRLLTDRIVELAIVPAISHETVRQSLKKTTCVPGKPSAS